MYIIKFDKEEYLNRIDNTDFFGTKTSENLVIFRTKEQANNKIRELMNAQLIDSATIVSLN